MSLAKKAGQAGGLMLFRKGWGALVNFGVMAYLARVLNKEDFGVVAISYTLITFVQVFALSGISEFLIFYRGADLKAVFSAGFWLTLFASIAIIIVVLIAAPFWADFYGDKRIVNILILISVGFFFNTLMSVPMALFRKDLNYKTLILIQTIFGTLSAISQVVFVFFGFGVYSLALPAAIIPPFMCLALFWKSGFLPQAYFGTEHWMKIIAYTKHIIGQRVLGKFVNEGDTLIIGKFFGMQILGVYNLAFQFANLFTAHFLPIITDISMPVFARNNQDPALVKRHYHKMIRLLAFITIPVIVLLILNAKFLITTIYGDKWIDAVLPFQILSIYVIVRSIGSPTSGLYNAMGKPQIGLYFTVVFTPIFLATILIGAYFNNLILLVLMISVLRVLGSFAHFILAARLLNDKLKIILTLLFPAFSSAGIAYFSVFLIPQIPEMFIILRASLYLLITWLLLRYLFWREYNLFIKDLVSMLPLKFQRIIPSCLL